MWDKPDEDSGIDNIEAGVEGSQHKTEFGGIGKKSLGCGSGAVHIHIVANESADHIDERTEYEEYPYHTEYVEEHVCKCCTPRLCVGRHGSQVWGDCGTDVLTHDESDALIDGQYTCRAEYHGDGHDGCWRLHAHGEYATYDEEG